MGREYRVIWQREGMARRVAIRQTERGALNKVENLLWSDAAGRPDEPADFPDDRFGRMPRLAERPRIESREVGDWEAWG